MKREAFCIALRPGKAIACGAASLVRIQPDDGADQRGHAGVTQNNDALFEGGGGWTFGVL